MTEMVDERGAAAGRPPEGSAGRGRCLDGRSTRQRPSTARGWIILIVAAALSCRKPAPPRPPQAPRTLPPPAGVPPGATRAEGINPRLLRRFRPIAQTMGGSRRATDDLVSLGRMLWYDPRLSGSSQISCNSCHDLDQAGVDHRPTSPGDHGQRGKRNAPTVYNSGGHIAEFWDGRARNLEEQAAGPLLNPVEMAATPESVVATLTSIADYERAFHRAFPDQSRPVTFDNVTKALAAFEEGLVTKSRWDAFLAGDRQALTSREIHGLRVFLQVGCVGCHTGPQVGASMFKVAGFVEPWPNQHDQGRFEVTGAPRDRMVFKVPTMKNVARTAPYFHDGSCEELPRAVRLMGRYQLGLELSEDEVSSIVAFLGALSGDASKAYIARPPLPGTGAQGVERGQGT